MTPNTGLTLRQAYEQNNRLMSELTKALGININDSIGRLEDIPENELDDNDPHDLQDELDLINRLIGYTQALHDYKIIQPKQLSHAWKIALDI